MYSFLFLIWFFIFSVWILDSFFFCFIGHSETENKSPELKRLGFVRVVTIQAKQNSGPLRSTVGTVEAAVTTVVSPVYDKFKGIPDYLLSFLDKKV